MSVSELVALISACAPRSRLASAVGHVTGFGSPAYGALIQLVIILGRDPGEAVPLAAGHAADFPGGYAQQAARAVLVAGALDVVDHDAPPGLPAALRAYAGAA